MSSNRIEVTKATLPPLDAFQKHVADIFASCQLTNQGSKLTALESRLKAYLGVPALAACANGTLALQLAIRYLGLNGKKVVTTPFTYVAIVSALLWEGCEVVFADIDPDTLCLSAKSVEAELRRHPDVVGILPVHVFGNAVDVTAMSRLAEKFKVKVLYDAAHAFGCQLYGKSLFQYGNAAIGSFHSTKLFHTVEGGFVVASTPKAQEKLGLLRAFGHIQDDYRSLGINAKMSELHAAMGLCLLPHVEEFIAARKTKTNLYDSLLAHHAKSRGVKLADGLRWNHSYYPRIFADEAVMHGAIAALAKENIFPRRYFHPSLTQLPYLQAQMCPVADSVANRIICLPLWPDMDDEIVRKTAEIILTAD